MNNAVVVGTGLMGPSIAATLAAAGLSVAITGRNEARRDRALAQAQSMVPEPHRVRLRAGDWDSATFGDADLIAESVIEDESVKALVLQRVAGLCRDSALITTNTSSLSPSRLAAAVRRPERFAGLHFLNPAHLTGVVEIVGGQDTSAATVEALVALAERLGKRPVVVRREVPGFVWNRIQMAVLRECLHLVEEGVVSIADVDTAVSGGLAPRWLAAGPFMTADLGGNEVFRRVAEQVLPTLSNASSAGPGLAGGDSFYAWTAETEAAAVALRERALRLGDALAAACRPPPIRGDSDGEAGAACSPRPARSGDTP